MNSVTFREETLNQLKHIVFRSLTSVDVRVRVYLFGSWARGEEKRTSDIDIAIETEEPMSSAVWNTLREEIEESTIPYRVDIVDLHRANPSLVKKVKEEGIVWKDYNTG